jgi:hypothetical protein
MTIEELEAQGRLIPEAQLDASLEALMLDPRFPAILRLISSHRRIVEEILISPQTAGLITAATVMAHCAGGIDALEALRMRLSEILLQRSRPESS